MAKKENELKEKEELLHVEENAFREIAEKLLDMKKQTEEKVAQLYAANAALDEEKRHCLESEKKWCKAKEELEAKNAKWIKEKAKMISKQGKEAAAIRNTISNLHLIRAHMSNEKICVSHKVLQMEKKLGAANYKLVELEEHSRNDKKKQSAKIAELTIKLREEEKTMGRLKKSNALLLLHAEPEKDELLHENAALKKQVKSSRDKCEQLRFRIRLETKGWSLHEKELRADRDALKRENELLLRNLEILI